MVILVVLLIGYYPHTIIIPEYEPHYRICQALEHPMIVQERLGHSSISITLDTYSHVSPGLQQAAARGFDEVILPEAQMVNLEG